jgi:hypothetical protein
MRLAGSRRQPKPNKRTSCRDPRARHRSRADPFRRRRRRRIVLGRTPRSHLGDAVAEPRPGRAGMARRHRHLAQLDGDADRPGGDQASQGAPEPRGPSPSQGGPLGVASVHRRRRPGAGRSDEHADPHPRPPYLRLRPQRLELQARTADQECAQDPARTRRRNPPLTCKAPGRSRPSRPPADP